MNSIHTKKQKNKQSGFSVVELIVVLSIVAIMAGVSVFDYNKYRSAVERTNLAQDISLALREAQVYGISATEGVIGDKEQGDPDELFHHADGIIPNIIKDTSVRGVSFLLELEKNIITLYADNQTEPAHEHLFIREKDRIIDERRIKYRDVGFNYACLIDSDQRGTPVGEGAIDVSFQRPYPDSFIFYRDDPESSDSKSFSELILLVESSVNLDTNEYVHINSIGNIAVKSNYNKNDCR